MSDPDDALWRDRDFLRLWAAQTISALGSRISREAVPMTAILLLGASPTSLGVLGALTALPGVLLSPLAGVLVDRGRRRRLLIGADLARAAILLSVPVAAWLGALTMGQLTVVAAAVAALSMLFDIADRAFLPSLVGRERLLEANAKLGTTDAAAETVGPALAGALVAALSAPVAILADALSYLGSAALLTRIRRLEPIPSASEVETPAEEAPAEGARAALAGARAALTWPELRPIFLSDTISAFFGSFFVPLYLLFALETLELGPALLGLTIAMGGVGGLGGAALASRARGPRAMVRARVAGSLFVALIPLAQGPLWLATATLMLSQLVGDALMTVYGIHAATMRQQVVPDALQGRVNAAFHFSTGLLGAAGALVGGSLGAWLGVRETLGLAAAGIAVGGLALLSSPSSTGAPRPPLRA